MLLLGKYVQKDHSSTRTQTKWEEEKKKTGENRGRESKKKRHNGKFSSSNKNRI